MKIKYIGVSDPVYMINGKTYEVLSVENGWYRIIDEEGEDYLYPPELFEIVNDEDIED
ncbi:hypothetical protein [Fenollaria massiliensis]|uniref:hypothetical protein n=1 Tax=Fenollaria massiliensis TaxID=938288 RepID=UPI0004AE432B|nr:hypothetical protein [Fenollaria massiliensis]